MPSYQFHERLVCEAAPSSVTAHKLRQPVIVRVSLKVIEQFRDDAKSALRTDRAAHLIDALSFVHIRDAQSAPLFLDDRLSNWFKRLIKLDICSFIKDFCATFLMKKMFRRHIGSSARKYTRDSSNQCVENISLGHPYVTASLTRKRNSCSGPVYGSKYT